MDSVPQQLPLFVDQKRCSLCKTLKLVSAFRRTCRSHDGLSSWCILCARVKAREWRIEHGDRKKAADKAYREANRVHMSAKCIERYKENRDQYIEQRRQEYARNPEKYREQKRVWVNKNRERVREGNRTATRKRYPIRKEAVRQWVLDHPNEVKEYHKRHYRTHRDHWRIRSVLRRGRKNGVDGKPTLDLIEAFYADQNGLCAYCLTPLPEVYHLEHRIPLSREGTNEIQNLCLSCPNCNLRKGKKTEKEFRSLTLCDDRGSSAGCADDRTQEYP